MSEPWDLSCLDWRDRLLSGRPLVPDLPLFRDEADWALRVFKRLRIHDVIGLPTMGDAGGPWVFPIVEAMFGALDVTTMRRMIRELFLMVPKKNYKTGTGGLIMLTALIVNRRPAAELSLIAPAKDVADRAFSTCRGAIKHDPELSKVFHVQENIKRITHRRTDAKLEIKAADTDIVTGLKSTFTLVDETHVFAARGNADHVFTEIRGALAAMKDGFFGQITTQSKNPPAGVFRRELQNARDVRDGKLKLPVLAVLYELPEDMQKGDGWKQRRVWPFVNPNMGRSVDEQFLADELTKAEREGAGALALLASQHFNVEVGVGLRTDRWSGAEHWEAAVIERLGSLDELLERSEVATVGIDGGGLDDLLALAVVGREKGSRRWLLWVHCWAHRVALKRRQSEAQTWEDFEKAGELTIVEDLGEDVIGICDEVQHVRDSGLLPEKSAIGLDPVGIGQIVDELASRDIGNEEGGMIVGVSQGWKLSGAIKTVARKVADGTMVHGGQKIMAYAVGNAKVELKGNAETITKQVAGTAKIDPLMATFNAAALMSLNPTANTSVYNDVGLLSV